MATSQEPIWLEASESDSGYPIESLRVDGGMSDNGVFVQALADATGRPIEVSPVLEATTQGAGPSPTLAIGDLLVDRRAGDETFVPRRTAGATPQTMRHEPPSREQLALARAKAEATIPELSGLSF